ncbi:hypothetical protein WA026_006031 [Henosepilachna vigintioctopunctata]|uniref:Complex 1 LYR protein domain-containing protein n=1 Tax=Henosepilachna vigintioctopunctata TaxID=420089 RepID=A0AAW1TJU9_9CUCU
MTQKARIIELYKKLLHLGRDYPSGYEFFRVRLHNSFMRNSKETDPEKIEKMIDHGHYIAKELEALYMMKKYRTLKRRYYDK